MEIKMFYATVISDVEACVPQGSILALLLFLIYISDLSENLVSNDNLFVDDFSVFSVFKNIDDSGINLNNNSRTFQWKMIFNSDPTKEDLEIIFSLKNQTLNHPLVFYRIPFTQTKLQKNLRIFLDSKMTFKNHLKTISQKTNKTIGLLPKLKTSLRRPSVFAIYK